MDQYRDILTCFCTLITVDLDDYSEGRRKMRIPIVPNSLLREMLKESTEIFKNEPCILSVKPPICVVGDIHGHILDLLRIIKQYHLPPNQRYLFLGDIIDRGNFSLETAVLVLTMKVMYPKDVFVIRGNHEFAEIIDHSSFRSELINIYNDETLFDSFMECFNYIPIAANVGDYALCLHGGIGPNFVFVSQIEALQRPITNFENQLVTEILWSDPSNEEDVEYKESPRMMGNLFGKKPLVNCLQRNGFSYLIRGHQCVPNGCESAISHKVMTVFSASNYCGVEQNKCGILMLLQDETYETATFPPYKFITRNEASFVPLDIYHSSPRKAGASSTSVRRNSLMPGRRKMSRDNNEMVTRSMYEVSKIVEIPGTPPIPISPPKSARERPNRIRKYDDNYPETSRSYVYRNQRKQPARTVIKPTQQRPRRVSMPSFKIQQKD